MATLILQETYRALEDEMKSIDKIMVDLGEKIKEAREHGDLKENGEYHAAREEMSIRIYKKQLLQSHAPFRMIDDGTFSIDGVTASELGDGVCQESCNVEACGFDSFYTCSGDTEITQEDCIDYCSDLAIDNQVDCELVEENTWTILEWIPDCE